MQLTTLSARSTVLQEPTEQERKVRGAEEGGLGETEGRLPSFHSLPTFAYTLPLCLEVLTQNYYLI